MRTFVVGKREAVVIALFLLITILLIALVPHGVEAVTAAATQRKIPIYSVETEKKQIALTFDAAWGNSDTDELLKILDENGAKATFFFTGEWVSKYPDDVLKIYAAGHSCQNHSDKHQHIDKMTAEELRADIIACNEKLKAVTGQTPTLYRGPYGEYNNTLLSEVEKLNMYGLQWDTDSRDWQKKSVDYMVKTVTENVKNGSVVLFHNDLENTPAAVNEILKTLTKQGYSFVTADELIYKENYYIDSAGRQHKKTPA
ncbi:MAG: polysaccharide deacetylase family protein [Oscillospiraceae bacterium]|nr:polysaccharide deacetylase family protein [Oscillospiraceae bacterium]MBQ8338180.1 polysaccharide deacetylase family protein [Oscillospiraceae bacterium]